MVAGFGMLYPHAFPTLLWLVLISLRSIYTCSFMISQSSFAPESTVSFSRLDRWTRHTINHRDWQYRYASFLDIIEAETVNNACNDSTHSCWDGYVRICKAQGVFANSRSVECVQVLWEIEVVILAQSAWAFFCGSSAQFFKVVVACSHGDKRRLCLILRLWLGDSCDSLQHLPGSSEIVRIGCVTPILRNRWFDIQRRYGIRMQRWIMHQRFHCNLLSISRQPVEDEFHFVKGQQSIHSHSLN